MIYAVAFRSGWVLICGKTTHFPKRCLYAECDNMIHFHSSMLGE